MSEPPRLSLCMIVKNEGDCIGRCLNSVKDVVDEIIIVDTGSTDQTVEICQSIGARVFSFPWNGSFADARNYGINQAAGEWILWLDADEEVDAADRHKLRGNIYSDSQPIINIRLINYFGNEVNEDQVLSIAHPRIFRNQIGLKFVGNIHEVLNMRELNIGSEQLGYVDVKLHHYGYMHNVVEKKEKVKRNLKFLEQELESSGDKEWVHYHIATEYARINQFKEAFMHANLSIAGFIKKGLMPPALLYKLKYSILINTASWDGAWLGIERAVLMYPDYVDLKFFMGFILYNKKMYPEAIKAFEDCIELGEENLNYLILKGVGSFQAWYYKGLCHKELGQLDEAVHSFLKSYSSSSTFSSAVEALIELKQDERISIQALMTKVLDDDSQKKLLLEISSRTSYGV